LSFLAIAVSDPLKAGNPYLIRRFNLLLVAAFSKRHRVRQCSTSRFSRFPVRVEPWFWLMGFFLGGGIAIKSRQDFLMILLWIIVLFVSILVHELGHALTSRKMTGVIPSIKLWGMGGLAYPNTQLTQKQSFWVTWAGPLAGLGFFGLIVLDLAAPFMDSLSGPTLPCFSFFLALESIVRHTPSSPKWTGPSYI
jgi:hypothetical protein